MSAVTEQTMCENGLTEVWEKHKQATGSRETLQTHKLEEINYMAPRKPTIEDLNFALDRRNLQYLMHQTCGDTEKQMTQVTLLQQSENEADFQLWLMAKLVNWAQDNPGLVRPLPDKLTVMSGQFLDDDDFEILLLCSKKGCVRFEDLPEGFLKVNGDAYDPWSGTPLPTMGIITNSSWKVQGHLVTYMGTPAGQVEDTAWWLSLVHSQTYMNNQGVKFHEPLDINLYEPGWGRHRTQEALTKICKSKDNHMCDVVMRERLYAIDGNKFYFNEDISIPLEQLEEVLDAPWHSAFNDATSAPVKPKLWKMECQTCGKTSKLQMGRTARCSHCGHIRGHVTQLHNPAFTTMSPKAQSKAVDSHTESLANRDILAVDMKEEVLKSWRYWTPEKLKIELRDSMMLEVWRQAIWTSNPAASENFKKASETAHANILKILTLENGATAIEALKVEPTCYTPGISCRGHWDAFAIYGDNITLKEPAKWKLWRQGDGPRRLDHTECTVIMKDPHMAIYIEWWTWNPRHGGSWDSKTKIWVFVRVSHTCLEGKTLPTLEDRGTVERCTVKRPPARIAMVPSNEDIEASTDEEMEMEYSVEGDIPMAGLISAVGSEYFTEPLTKIKRTLGEISYEGWWTQLTTYLINSRVRMALQGLKIMKARRMVPNTQPALKECIGESEFYELQFKAHQRISERAHPSSVENRVATVLERMMGTARADAELTMPKRY